jgi:hypothetical protein
MAIKIRHDGQWVEVGVGSSVADGDYGDIVVSNSGATWTLDSSISGDKISEGDSKAEIIDTATESKLTVEIDATEKFSVDIGGPKIHRQDSSNEGGSVVFNRANDDNAAFEIDVYGSLNTDSGRLRILDQSGSSGVERFAIGPNGEIGLSGANYGTSGQVLTSNGSGSAPTWQTASGGGGGGSSTFIGLTDTPASLGNAGQIVAVNSGGTALEFIDQPSGGGGDPVGTIVAWAGSVASIPSEYQLCDGSAASTSALQAITGSNVPDLRDRFVVGAGNNYAVDATGGSADATLVSHSHTINYYGADDESGGPIVFCANFDRSDDSASTLATNSQGSSATNANLPPYYALCYIIKHTATSGSGGGGSNSGIGTVVSIEDDGSPVGTASTINFGDNLEVGLSGGVATITGVGTFSGDYNDLTNVPQMFGIPSGGIIMWSGAENLIGSTNAGGTGTGWVLCDGQTYTVDGVNVTPPDLRNRFVVGAGSGSNYNVGDTGGSDNVTLSSDEMPSHDHGSSSVSVSVNSSGLTVSSEPDHTHGTGTLAMDGQGAHNHNVRFYGGGTTGTVPSLRFDGGGHVDFATLTAIGNHAHNMSGSTGSGGSHNHSISGSISGSGTLSMSGEGGGQAHENRPPYYALCYIMKT